MYSRRLIAVDPSLTCSGWALFSADSGKLLGVGKLKSLGPTHPYASRLKDLQERIGKMLLGVGLGKNDVLLCEAPTTMKDPRAAIMVEQVRSIFETLGRDRGIIVPGRINPRSVHHQVMGLRGKQMARLQVKETAVEIVFSLYKGALEEIGFRAGRAELARHQDIVDAILIGNLGVTWIQEAKLLGISLEEFFEGRRKKRGPRAATGYLKRMKVAVGSR